MNLRNLKTSYLLILFILGSISDCIYLKMTDYNTNQPLGIPLPSSEIYGADFNGIYSFDNYSLGSDPWLIPEGFGKSAKIIRSFNAHSYIYELNSASRRVLVTNDMSSDWKVESYISLSNLAYVGLEGGKYVMTIHAPDTNWISWGYDQQVGNWFRIYMSTITNIQSEENWTSNSWMYWRIEFTKATDTYQFYINNTLLDTIVYSGINAVDSIEFASVGWGYAGLMRIDSLCYSWHKKYFNNMLFKTHCLGKGEFNGIETFATNAVGSDPWTWLVQGPAQIIDSRAGHSKVYELNYASRGINNFVNDMESDWTMEFYIMLEYLEPRSEGAIMFILITDEGGGGMEFGYNNLEGCWCKSSPHSGGGNLVCIQDDENWTSNSWMHWKVTWNASEDNFRFFVNNTLLTTEYYPDFDVLGRMNINAYYRGNPGKIWIDSFSWSWHSNYYDRIIYDLYEPNPNVNEEEFDPVRYLIFTTLMVLAAVVLIFGIIIIKIQKRS